MLVSTWKLRSPQRLHDAVWKDTLGRVRGEFSEMPSVRVTAEEARALFGLTDPASSWILDRLAAEGFLVRTEQGVYLRRTHEP